MADTAKARVVDFSNVKEGGGNFNKRRVPSGDYLAKVVKVQDAEVKKGENQGTPQFLFTIVLEKYPTSKYPYYCTLVENQLWKLRNLLVAAGINVPKARAKVDPNRAVGRLVGVTMEDDEYEGKLQSVVAAVFPSSELSEGSIVDDSADAEADGSGEDEDGEGTPQLAATDDEDEEIADEVDPVDAMDRNELKVAIREHDPEARFKTSESDDDLRGRLRALTATGAVGDDEEEEVEEPEPTPPPKKARKAAPAKPAATEDEELEELDIEDL